MRDWGCWGDMLSARFYTNTNVLLFSESNHLVRLINRSRILRTLNGSLLFFPEQNNVCNDPCLLFLPNYS